MQSATSETVNPQTAVQVLRELDRICASVVFYASKRCQELLRYLVVETLEGRGERVTERSIAKAVFGRDKTFQPDEFSLVRVKTSEVRKRLLEFYSSNTAEDVRIELPTRTYCMRFAEVAPPLLPEAPRVSAPADTIEVQSSAPEAKKPVREMSRRNMLRLSLLSGAACAGIGAVAFRLSSSHAPIDLLWRPITSAKNPLLIYIPVMRRADESLTEWVGIGPASVLSRASEFLEERRCQFRVRFGDELTFSQLTEQPSLLLGGFIGKYTQMALQNCRFTAAVDPATGDRAIVDNVTKRSWQPVWHRPDPYVSVDYGLVSRLIHPDTGQTMISAVGIQTFGTAGAADVLFNPEFIAEFVRTAPAHWDRKNFQALVRVDVKGAATSPAQLIATHFW